MAERNDDIKNLFLNLGLNPSDYHEIRTAPSANATVSEAPRRWSLLQEASAIQSGVAALPPVSIMSSLAVPPPQPVFAAAPVVPAAVTASVRLPTLAAQPEAERVTSSSVSQSMAAVLFAAASDIARAEAGERSTATVAPPLPAAAASNHKDDLQSLFQSVKEPQTVSMMPESFVRQLSTGRPDDSLHGRTPAVTTPTQRAGAQQVLMPPPSRRLPNDDTVTRSEPPPLLSRLGPVPAPATAPSQSAVGEGRLRFSTPVAEPAGAVANGDSLRHVFARLSRDNRR